MPLEVSFQDHSIGGATSWLWDFGDGATSTQCSLTHVYTQIGVYTVSLTVSNLHGFDTHTWVEGISAEPWMLFLPLAVRIEQP